ncbi:capsular exopolysaccharide synthesis family protein [Agromyces flavus]|uniref:Capsular exopolysaccharide family n=1 Tax=Agromyces flavus TaxID=589382 RepID=A0A1H1Z766_9MICO|nr:polysaccharide biosynthesis tyrosine autokinase [Agromyces flavus]MCP2366951.1 capsular exopolysaccharide synthesis family protein [Agromyces flavus]GGI46698.1 chromosome partitioning protein [Agromyces flavus]SDT29407.1 capsular exopolysaccharide family [Agromyces flavus]
MELRDYLRGLRRHWLAITLMTLLGVGTAYGWSLLQTPVYEATASGVVQAKTEYEIGQLISDDGAARAKVPTLLDMAGWKEVAEEAIDDLGLTASPEAVAARVTVENPENTSIIKFTARANTPEEAAALAQAWIDALAVTVTAVDGDDNPTQISIYSAAAATVPSAPVFPDTRTALIVGGVLGLGAGIAFALIRTASDRRIRATDDVEAKLHVPVMGTIPSSPVLAGVSSLLTGTPNERSFPVAEALRTLRTNLRFMDVDNPPRKIVVTSPLPGDGKSTIACNLALTLARSGEPVVLVDGDLRRPMVASNLELPGGAGLSDVLTGRASVADVLQRTPHDAHLLVLAAGTIPPNPSEVLGSARMRQLLEDLAKHATVIIDAPPLLAVTDGAVLTQQADGALLVVGVGKTNYDFVEKALDAVHKVNGRALGLVLNKVPLKGGDASPYAAAAYVQDYASGSSRKRATGRAAAETA